ncbi:MAG: hypothetical protein WDO56_10145 [Gammaproteobacteria bacterium]
MTTDSKKLLANHAPRLTEQVAAARLKHAGVVLGKDLGLKTPKSGKNDLFSPGLIKRLAGGQ